MIDELKIRMRAVLGVPFSGGKQSQPVFRPKSKGPKFNVTVETLVRRKPDEPKPEVLSRTIECPKLAIRKHKAYKNV